MTFSTDSTPDTPSVFTSLLIRFPTMSYLAKQAGSTDVAGSVNSTDGEQSFCNIVYERVAVPSLVEPQLLPQVADSIGLVHLE